MIHTQPFSATITTLLIAGLAACGSSFTPAGAGGGGGAGGTTSGVGGAMCMDVVKDISASKPTTAHWTYEEEGEWGTLDPAYSACGTAALPGASQTPIDIPQGGAMPDPGAVTFKNYAKIPLHVFTNGHTVQENYASAFGEADPQVSFGGETYFLVQFHYHTPSEHKVDGVGHAMELHLVHKLINDKASPLLVVGVFLDAGAAQATLGDMLAGVPEESWSERDACKGEVDLGGLLPAKKSFFAYTGSLTTPPCSVGVQWVVMKDPMSVGAAQQAAFEARIGKDARPTQPLDSRPVLVHLDE
jgi:carbonic anhydrase